MKKHVSEALLSLQNEKIRFWSVFQVYKMKKHVCEAFLSLQNEKSTFLKRFNWSIFVSPNQNFWFAAFFLKDKKRLINVNENRVFLSWALVFETSANEVTYIFIGEKFPQSQIYLVSLHSWNRKNSSSEWLQLFCMQVSEAFSYNK